MFTLRGILFEEFHRHALRFQDFGDGDAALATADDEGALNRRLLLDAHETQRGIEILPRRHDVDVIPWPQDLVTVGDDEFLAAKNHRDHGVLRRPGANQIAQALAGKPAVVLNVHTEDLDLAAGEITDIRHPGNGEYVIDTSHDVAFRVYDPIDAHPPGREHLLPVYELPGAQPYGLGGGRRLGVGNQAGKYIGFVAVGRRNHHLRRGDSGAAPGGKAPGAPVNDPGIEVGLEILAARPVQFQDHEFIAFPDQALGDGFGALPAAGDEDTHQYTSLMAVSQPWRGGGES